MTALASTGPGGNVSRLSPDQVLRLRPSWTSARPRTAGSRTNGGPWPGSPTLIGRLFHVSYTLRGVSYLLHRMGYTPQVPKHRAVQRDEDAIAAWRATTWAKVRG